MLLQEAQGRDWYPLLVDGLAVAGETGTLELRFLDTAAEGDMRAKTGTIHRIRVVGGDDHRRRSTRVLRRRHPGGEPFPKMQVVDALLGDIAADRSYDARLGR